MCTHSRTSLFTFNDQISVLSLTSSSERRDNEANVEVHGQDEVFQEAIHVPLPRLPHHLSALFQPLYGWWIRAGKSSRRWEVDSRLMKHCDDDPRMLLSNYCSHHFAFTHFVILGGWKKAAGRDADASCKLWKIRPHIQRSVEFLWDY